MDSITVQANGEAEDAEPALKSRVRYTVFPSRGRTRTFSVTVSHFKANHGFAVTLLVYCVHAQ